MKVMLSGAVLCLSMLSTTLSAQQCEELLNKSIQTSHKCLDELYMFSETESVIQGMSKADLYGKLDDAKQMQLQIGVMEDRIITLERSNSALSAENTLLKKENVELRVKYDALALEHRELSIKFESIKAEYSSLTEKANLQKRYKNYAQSELIDDNAYRVPTFMLNARKGHSSKFAVSAVYKRDEVIRFYDVYEKVVGGKSYFWLKVKKGWMYAPDSIDPTVRASFKDYLTSKNHK